MGLASCQAALAWRMCAAVQVLSMGGDNQVALSSSRTTHTIPCAIVRGLCDAVQCFNFCFMVALNQMCEATGCGRPKPISHHLQTYAKHASGAQHVPAQSLIIRVQFQPQFGDENRNCAQTRPSPIHKTHVTEKRKENRNDKRQILFFCTKAVCD